MSFSSAWEALAKKPFGEALSIRVYARERVANYYVPTPKFETLSYATKTSIDTYESPTNSDVFEITGSTLNEPRLIYYLPAIVPVSGNLLLSFYAHSAHTPTNDVLITVVEEYHSDDTKTSSQIYWDYNTSAKVWEVSSTVGAQTSGDSEVVSGVSGWSRCWLSTPILSADSKWVITVLFPWNSGFESSFVYSSPMIEFNKDTPGNWAGSLSEDFNSAPGPLSALSNDATTLSMNPIAIEREREFGVSQGQRTSIRISNADFIEETISYPGTWCAVQAGFPNADIWETVGQGRITSTNTSTNLGLTLNIDDGVMAVVESQLPRDVTFTGEPGWISTIDDVEVDDDSGDYEQTGRTEIEIPGSGQSDTVSTDIDAGVEIYQGANSGAVQDERFEIVFSSGTEFRIRRENGHWVNSAFDASGNTLTGLTTVQNGVVFNTSDNVYISATQDPNTPAIVIYSGGWDWYVSGSTDNNPVDTGLTTQTAYTEGDTFEFTTSAPRTDRQLTPMGMVRHLIEDVANVQVYNVVDGGFYDSPLYDVDNWEALIDVSALGGRQVAGFWERGTRVIELVQDALKFELGVIHPTHTGQIAGWFPNGQVTGTTQLNGIPGNAAVNVMTAERVKTLEEYATKVSFKYLDIETGDEKTYTRDVTTGASYPQHREIKSKWRAKDSTAAHAVNYALLRYKDALEKYKINCTTDLAGIQMSEAVYLSEPMLNAYGEKLDVVGKEFDVLGQQVMVSTWNDPLTNLQTFILAGPDNGDAESVLGNTERVLG